MLISPQGVSMSKITVYDIPSFFGSASRLFQKERVPNKFRDNLLQFYQILMKNQKEAHTLAIQIDDLNEREFALYEYSMYKKAAERMLEVVTLGVDSNNDDETTELLINYFLIRSKIDLIRFVIYSTKDKESEEVTSKLQIAKSAITKLKRRIIYLQSKLAIKFAIPLEQFNL